MTAKDRASQIAIIGSGISSAYVLIHLISRLERRPAGKPTRVVVIEKSGEFWTGVAYGSRSGRDSLLISSLKEFLPREKDRLPFVEWLGKNRERLFAHTGKEPGAMTAKWLRANQEAMDSGRWDDLFIPRFTFGVYIQERLREVLATAAARGILECELVHGDAFDIQREEDGYALDVTLDSGSEVTLRARKIVLAIGSPQNTGLQTLQPAEADPGSCFIEDLYLPSLADNLQKIEQFLKTPAGRAHNDILIAGSNASALEALYVLSNFTDTTGQIGKFFVVSPSGEFPHRINPEPTPAGYPPKNLHALVARGARTAQEILEAVTLDVSCAKAHGASIADMHGEVSTGILAALDQLPPAEQGDFVVRVGVEIGRLQRRAGAEYLNVVDRLIAGGKLEFIKGRLHAIASAADDRPGFSYRENGAEIPQKRAASIGVTIGCVGAVDLAKTAAPLMQNLIRRKLCAPNASRRGFIVNEHYEASENFYIMGPLIAGNYVGTIRVWHAESCHRIISIAERFAEVLAAE